MIFESEHFSNIYDSQFKALEGLRWYPAVGRNYPSNKYKILIVGESHYGHCDSYECPEYQTALSSWSAPDSTRICIIEDRFDFLWDRENKTYRNISELLATVSRPIPEAVWENISYYNLVQNLLPNIKYRPSYDQLIEGVKFLNKIIEILKPDLCIIIGVSSRNAFRDSNNTFTEIKHKVKNSKPFQLLIDGIPVISIPHLSRTGFNSLYNYRNFITKYIPNAGCALNYIANISKDTLSTDMKFNILTGNIFKKILLRLCALSDDLENIDDTFIHDGTPYFGFKVKDANFRIAFNFWEKDFKGLTAGFYFPNGISEMDQDDYKEYYTKEDGWNVYSHWIFYDVYRLYNWCDMVFDSINDGSIEIVLKSILESCLLPEIPRLKK